MNRTANTPEKREVGSGSITPTDYREGVDSAYILVRAIRSVDFAGMLAAIDRAEALGPVLNPTLFKARDAVLREDKSVIAILAHSKAELSALPWPAEDDDIAMRARRRLPFDLPGAPQDDRDAAGSLLGEGVL